MPFDHVSALCRWLDVRSSLLAQVAWRFIADALLQPRLVALARVVQTFWPRYEPLRLILKRLTDVNHASKRPLLLLLVLRAFGSELALGGGALRASLQLLALVIIVAALLDGEGGLAMASLAQISVALADGWVGLAGFVGLLPLP